MCYFVNARKIVNMDTSLPFEGPKFATGVTPKVRIFYFEAVIHENYMVLYLTMNKIIAPTNRAFRKIYGLIHIFLLRARYKLPKMDDRGYGEKM